MLELLWSSAGQIDWWSTLLCSQWIGLEPISSPPSDHSFQTGWFGYLAHLLTSVTPNLLYRWLWKYQKLPFTCLGGFIQLSKDCI